MLREEEDKGWLVSNVIPFRAIRDTAMDDGKTFLEDADVRGHAVQFYDSDDYLVGAVARFLATGLRGGERIIVVATAAHREAFMRRLETLGVDPALAAGQVTLLDARASMARFMDRGMPHPVLFRELVSGLGGKKHPVRFYGEMVDLLWQDGNSEAAIALENLWTEAQDAHGFTLLCAYGMDRFHEEGDGSGFRQVCHAHSHVIPTEDFSQLDDPRARLLEISVLQQRARALETEIKRREGLEKSLRAALDERRRAEDELRVCVQREKEARERAEASDSFKEMFLGILGHDLRNPLNTVLTTARLMTMASETTRDGARRLKRILSSGVRMERMISQLLDVARARLTDGIPIPGAVTQDLTPLASKIVEEFQAANPGRRIDLRCDGGPCLAHVDADRFEQVASNLIGNALVHGDAQAPITVALASHDGTATFSVHNLGRAIDPLVMPVLFDPFKRGREPGGRMDGLGLGLYIVERIVSAHGGRVDVQSSADFGTRFSAVFPAVFNV